MQGYLLLQKVVHIVATMFQRLQLIFMVICRPVLLKATDSCIYYRADLKIHINLHQRASFSNAKSRVTHQQCKTNRMQLFDPLKYSVPTSCNIQRVLINVEHPYNKILY
jgi:hypothetical protein